MCNLLLLGRSFAVVHRTQIEFICKVAKLQKYLNVVLEQLPFCYCWRHRGFWNSSSELYLPDGVHLNKLGTGSSGNVFVVRTSKPVENL